jgi:hypothetical protein
MTDDFSDEELMAYADGALAPERSARLVEILPGRPDLARRIAVFARTSALAAESVKARTDEPVPDKLKAAVEAMIRKAAPASATVTPLRPRKSTPSVSPFGNWAMPIAASFLGVAAGAIGYWLASGGAPGQGYYQVAGIADPELAAVLSKLPSGEKVRLKAGEEVSMTSSFYRGDQVLCREFAIAGPDKGDHLAVACRSADAWSIDLALRTGGAAADDYKPASSAETLDAFLNALGAGPAIEGQAEADALGKLR